jgi:hypothetical protein
METIRFAFKYDAKIVIPLLMICFGWLNPISQTCVVTIDVLAFQFENKIK